VNVLKKVKIKHAFDSAHTIGFLFHFYKQHTNDNSIEKKYKKEWKKE